MSVPYHKNSYALYFVSSYVGFGAGQSGVRLRRGELRPTVRNTVCPGSSDPPEKYSNGFASEN